MRDADEVLEQLAVCRAGQADISEVLECILAEFKGGEGLARELRLCYEANNSHKGNQNQVRILDNIVKLVLNVGGQSSEESASVEDLEAEARNLLGES